MSQFTVLTSNDIAPFIYTIRNVSAMLDSDVARLYETTTKKLNQQVKRNQNRFSSDLVFQLTDEEQKNLRSQIVTANIQQFHEDTGLRSQFVTANSKSLPPLELQTSKGSDKYTDEKRRSNPYVFTEEGILMLSTVMSNDRAAKVTIAIVKTIVWCRKIRESEQELASQFKEFKKDHDSQMAQLFQLIQSQRKPILDYTVPIPPVRPAFQETSIKLIKLVARFHSISVKSLIGPQRLRSIFVARQIAIYFLRKHLKLSYSQIGRICGGRDHATIISAYRKFEKELSTSSELASHVRLFEKAWDDVRNTPNSI